MDGGPDRIPDGIQPITGYRAWRYRHSQQGAELHSLNCYASGLPLGPCQWESAGSGWVVASCAAGPKPEHLTPGEDCRCGFYAMKTLEVLLEEAPIPPYLLGIPIDAEEDTILGRVELAGKIVEHEFGYRAERARIAELLPFAGTESKVMAVAAGLGLPVGESIALPTPDPHVSLSPREVQVLQKVAYGASTRQIAWSLQLSPNTVNSVLHAIFEKLDDASRLQATTQCPPRWTLQPALPGPSGPSRGRGGFTVAAVVRWPLNVVSLVSLVVAVSVVGGALTGGG